MVEIVELNDENCKIEIPLIQFYNSYKEYCNEVSDKFLTFAVFSKRMRTLVKDDVRFFRIREKGLQQRYVRGIKLYEDKRGF